MQVYNGGLLPCSTAVAQCHVFFVPCLLIEVIWGSFGLEQICRLVFLGTHLVVFCGGVRPGCVSFWGGGGEVRRAGGGAVATKVGTLGVRADLGFQEKIVLLSPGGRGVRPN